MERFDILPYEEMALYYPQANQKRPLILVGPPSIGRHELRLRLLEDKNRFAAAVPRNTIISIPNINLHCTVLAFIMNQKISLICSKITNLEHSHVKKRVNEPKRGRKMTEK